MSEQKEQAITQVEHDGTYGVKKVSPFVKGAGNTLIRQSQDPLQEYRISDIDDGDPQYYGFLNQDGGWYIMKINAGAVTYAKGDSGYDFSARVGASYAIFSSTF